MVKEINLSNQMIINKRIYKWNQKNNNNNLKLYKINLKQEVWKRI
jgi:hypothetical protein